MLNLGDRAVGSTLSFLFNTHKSDGTPITLAGTPVVSVYKNSTTESTSGVTLTVDYDSRTGMHNVVIDTSADGTFYATGNDFNVVITTGTVNSVSVVGTCIGKFSIGRQNISHAASVAWASGAITDAVFAAATYPKAIRTATVDSAAAAYVNLDGSASAVDNFYTGCSIKIASGTGAGQSRTIILYTGSTKRAYVDKAWATNPDGASVFVINAGKLTIDVSNVGLAAAGAASTITLAASASAVNEYYDGAKVIIVSGTGTGQSRVISGYVGSTRVATITDGWGTQPDTTSLYAVIGLGDVEVGVNNDKTGYSIATNGISATSIATDAINAASIKGDAVTKIQNGLATPTNITAGTITTVTNLTNSPTAGDFTATMKASLNSATPAVTVSDKTGFSLSTAGVKAVWDQLTSALTTVGSIGKKLTDWVLGSDSKALLSSDAQSGVTIPTVTTVTNAPADMALNSTVMKSASYTAPDNASIAAIKAKTDSLNFTGTDVKATLDSEQVVVATNNDKTGYVLTAGEHTTISADVATSLAAYNTTGVAKEASVLGIQNNTRFVATVPQYLLIPTTGDEMYLFQAIFYDTNGVPADPDSNELSLRIRSVDGEEEQDLYNDFAATTPATVSPTWANYYKMVRLSTGKYQIYYKLNNVEEEEQWIIDFALKYGTVEFDYSRTTVLVMDEPGTVVLADGSITAAKFAANAVSSSAFAQEAADKVWGTTSRAITDKAGFSISGAKQTLDALNDITAASVWAVATRTLTGFGTLVADIWASVTRTLTGAVTITSNSDITAIKAKTDLIPAAPASTTNITAAVVTLAASQPNYAPAKAGNQMDLVNAPNATAVSAIQSGLSRPGTAQTITSNSDITAIKTKTDKLNFTGTDIKATLDSETVTVGTNNDKTGYKISGTKQTLDNLNDITAATVWGYTTRTLTSISIVVSDIAAGVWAYVTRTLTSGTGIGLSQQQVRDAMKLAPSGGSYQAGSVDKQLDDIQAKTDLLPADPASDTQVNTRLAASAYSSSNNASIAAIKAKTDNLPSDPASNTEVDTRLATSAYTAPLNSSITAIKAKTDNLPSDPASNTQVNTRLSTAGYTAPDNAGIAGIKAKTDQITFTGGLVDANMEAISGETAPADALSEFTAFAIQTQPGLFAISITTTDGTNPVADVRVQIISGSGQVVSEARTDGSGQVSGAYAFKLDAGTYTVRMAKVGYTYEDQTLVVTADASVTYEGLQFDPTQPAVGNQTLYGYVRNVTGAVAVGATVRATPVKQNQFVDNAQITLYSTTTTTNADGYWELAVVKGSRIKVDSIYEEKTYYLKTFTVSQAGIAAIEEYEDEV